jgi:multiple sugar transport system substrate-binding protein
MDESRRRFLRRAGVAAAATTTLAGCSGGGGGGGSGGGGGGGGGTPAGEQRTISGDKGEVHFLSAENSSAFKQYYQKWAERFSEETGYGVRLEFVGVGSSQSARISRLLQAGDPPELTTTAPEKGGGLALQGVLADLSDQAQWMEELYGYDFNEDFLFSLQGNQYVVPIWVNMTMDWYRVSTWEEEAGMAPREPTWDEFLEGVQATDGAGERRGTCVPAGQTLMATEYYIDHMFQNGGQIFERNGDTVEIVMDQGENRQLTKEVLEYIGQLNDVSVDGSGYGYGPQIESYWSEQVNEVKYFGARPLQQAVANNEAVAEDTGLMHPPSNAEQTHQAFSEGWVMFDAADNKEGAREFVQFMSRPEPLYELLHIAPLHNLPPFPAAVDDEEFLDNEFIDTWVRPNDHIRIEDVVKMVETAKTLVGETDPNNALASPVFSESTFGNMLFNYLHGDMSIDEAIDQAGDRSREVMANFEQ